MLVVMRVTSWAVFLNIFIWYVENNNLLLAQITGATHGLVVWVLDSGL